MKHLALAALLLLVPEFAFAQSAISQLPIASTPLAGNEAVPVVQSGTTVQAPAFAFAIPVASTSAPANPVLYQQWWNTSATPAQLDVYDGTQWVVQATLDGGAHLYTPLAFAPQIIDLNVAPAQTPTLSGTVLQLGNLDSVTARVTNRAFNASAYYSTLRGDGTATTPSPLSSGEEIGGFNFFGYDSDTPGATPNASVSATTAENWSPTAHGTVLDLSTTPTGSLTSVKRWQVEADGALDCPTATGGDQGAGSLNACGGMFINGVAVSTGSGSVSSIATGTGLTGGTITTSGTLSLAPIANDDVLANISGSAAAPGAATLTALFDAALGSTRGSTLERGSSGWGILAPGTSGRALISGGSGADPSYAVLGVSGGGTGMSSASGTALDNIAGFATNGFVERTGAGAYSLIGSTGTGNVVLASGAALSGTPTAPTAAANTNTSQIATTNFVETDDAKFCALSGCTMTGQFNTPAGMELTAGGMFPASSNGMAFLLTTSANGLEPRAQGSTNDYSFENSAGIAVLQLPTGTRIWKFPGAFVANGSVATSLGSLGPAGSNTTVQEWFEVVDAAGTTRFIPSF